MAAKPKAVDWTAIEVDYRAGILTDREIGKRHGLSHTAVQKRARADGWFRDLKQRIRDKAADKVARAEVARKVAKPAILATESQVVEANASMQARITLEHRADVKRARAALQALMDELETYGVSRDQLEALAEVAAKRRLGEEPDRKALDKAIEAMLDGMDFPSRVGAAHKLTDALVKCVTLERTVAGISDTEADESLIVGALKRLHERAAAARALSDGRD